jgi:hypothetical protein
LTVTLIFPSRIIVGGKDIVSLVDYAKKYKISHSNLINKAKRQTIEAFSEAILP